MKIVSASLSKSQLEDLYIGMLISMDEESAESALEGYFEIVEEQREQWGEPPPTLRDVLMVVADNIHDMHKADVADLVNNQLDSFMTAGRAWP